MPYQLSGPKNFLDSRAPWKVSRPPQNCASFTPLIENLVAEGTSIDKVRIGKVSGNEVSDPPRGTVKPSVDARDRWASEARYRSEVSHATRRREY